MTFRISQNTNSKASASLLYRSQPTAGSLTGSQRLDVFSSTPVEESYLPGLRPRLQQSTRLFGKEIKPFTVTGDADGTAADRGDAAADAPADGKGGGDKEGGTIDVGVSGKADIGIAEIGAHFDYSGPAPSCSGPADRNSTNDR